MLDHFRLFEVGPDPFGRSWKVQFRWLQTAIAIRHADAVDVKFFLTSSDEAQEEKVVALPLPALQALAKAEGRPVTDSWCMKLAALHVKHMIDTAEDMEKTLVTVTAAELSAYERELSGSPVAKV